MIILLLVLLFGAGGLQAQDYRNATITCSFTSTDVCFSWISALGGNFSAVYAETAKEMNMTCQRKGEFQSCIKSIPTTCSARTTETTGKVNSIGIFVDNLCKNGSDDYMGFLNSSVCYNKYRKIRIDCVTQHATNGTDAKSLCCKSKKIQECLKTNMTVCGKNSTSFQNHLVSTYSMYTNALCGPYFNLCNAAVSKMLSFACILLVVKTVILNL